MILSGLHAFHAEQLFFGLKILASFLEAYVENLFLIAYGAGFGSRFIGPLGEIPAHDCGAHTRIQKIYVNGRKWCLGAAAHCDHMIFEVLWLRIT